MRCTTEPAGELIAMRHQICVVILGYSESRWCQLGVGGVYDPKVGLLKWLPLDGNSLYAKAALLKLPLKSCAVVHRHLQVQHYMTISTELPYLRLGSTQLRLGWCGRST